MRVSVSLSIRPTARSNSCWSPEPGRRGLRCPDRGCADGLIGLLDGAYDGDALFFSRDLVIEGDTAAVLALRNAIEDTALTPDLALSVPERFGPLVNGGLRWAGRSLRRLLGAPGEIHPYGPSAEIHPFQLPERP
jgi:hypothetical protein